MKMPEKDLHNAILAAKEQRIGQSLRLQWRTFCGRYNGGAFTKQDRRNDVRHYRLVHS